MSAETNGTNPDFNIFLYLAKLEQDGMKASNQTQSAILAKLNYQEEEYKNQIAQWKDESNKIGDDAKKAQKAADKSGGFFNSIFADILAFCCWGIFIYMAVEGKGMFGGGDGKGDEAKASGDMQKDVQNANMAQTQVQQTQQKMSMTENIELNSQQQAQQSMQNEYNSMLQNYASMGSYNNQRG